MRNLLLIILLATLCACQAKVPFEKVPSTAPTAVGLERLLDDCWCLQQVHLRFRHTATVKIGWKEMPLTGILDYRPAVKQARLVALNDMGIKLIDLSVTADGHEAHFLFPQLAEAPGLSEAVAKSVRAIFLQPLPGRSDELRLETDGYRLDAADGVSFTFGGENRDLINKTSEAAGNNWWVGYYEYRDTEFGRLPGGVIFEDLDSGLRLTLWLESVKRIDG